MKEISLPKKIRVGGFIYDVIYPYVFNTTTNDIKGIHSTTSSTIKITKFANDKIIRSKEKIMETFLHEVIHAIDASYLGGRLEEDDVAAIAFGIFDVIRNNKFFIMKEKIPKKFRVGGFVYSVIHNFKFTDSTTNDIFSVEYDLLEIRFATIVDNEPHSLEFIRFLFLLGELYAIFNNYNVKFFENAEDKLQLMHAFCSGVKQVFEDNKLEECIRRVLIINEKD
jgi:hypothetical protein